MEKTKENLTAVFSHPMEKTTELDSSQGRKDTNCRKESCGLKLRKKTPKNIPNEGIGTGLPRGTVEYPILEIFRTQLARPGATRSTFEVSPALSRRPNLMIFRDVFREVLKLRSDLNVMLSAPDKGLAPVLS